LYAENTHLPLWFNMAQPPIANDSHRQWGLGEPLIRLVSFYHLGVSGSSWANVVMRLGSKTPRPDGRGVVG
jgi:hypothetical protein